MNPELHHAIHIKAIKAGKSLKNGSMTHFSQPEERRQRERSFGVLTIQQHWAKSC